MYLDYYKLKHKPFQISTDPKFLWLGEKHKEALAVLKYGILDNKGFLLLTGDVGTGKTTLLNALIQSLGENVRVAMVTDPGLGKMDFFNFVADSFEMSKSFKSKGEFLIHLKNYLFELYHNRKQALLIIDEAQHLNQKMLEEVRLLSNIESYNAKLINIFFVGQSEFNEIILRPRNRAIRQRITINYNISPLTESETGAYIRFRLSAAGSDNTLFSSRAIKEVFKFSNGYPRLINIICDQALLTGFVKEKSKIDEQIVAECAGELKIPTGLPVHKSKATPEAGESIEKITPSPVDPADIEAPVDIQRPSRSFSRTLMVVLIALMVLWIGLVSIYLLRQKDTLLPLSTTNLDAGSSRENKENGQPLTNIVSKKIVTTPQKIQSSSTSNPLDKISDEKNANVDNKSSEPDKTAATNVQKTEIAPVSLLEIQQAYGQFPTVYFGFDSNSLEPDAYALLQMVARYCIQNPQSMITLKGYSDSSGGLSYNLKLSEFRANMVKTYLVGRGVKPMQIKIVVLGPDKQSMDGKQRKVVIEIMAPGQK